MAYTVTSVYKDVKGSQRTNMLYVTTDAASDTIATGMEYVLGYSMCPVSMASTAVRFRPNLTAASAACNGCIGISGTGSADLFYLMVYGR